MSITNKRGFAVLAAFIALAITRSVAAFPTSRLVYARGPGAEQCPDQTVIRHAVATRLGYDPFFPTSDKTIVARVLRDADQLRGQVELVDEQGVQLGLREFTAPPEQCADLVRAMALSISIAIDPKSAETYGQGPPDEAPAPSAPSDTAKPDEPKPPARERDRRHPEQRRERRGVSFDTLFVPRPVDVEPCALRQQLDDLRRELAFGAARPTVVSAVTSDAGRRLWRDARRLRRDARRPTQ